MYVPIANPYYLLDDIPYIDPDGDGVFRNPYTDEEYPGGGIYINPDNPNLYFDLDDDGVFVNPFTGEEYTGGGQLWIPEGVLTEISDLLADIAVSDSSLARYSIPNDVLPTLYGGKVSTEITLVVTGSDRPHTYTPPVWYIQRSNSDGIIFLDEPFFHGTASGGSIVVYDEAITIRDGSSKAIYWSSCTTHFSDSYLPSPYSSYPIQYVCWQCMYGSLSDALIGTSEDTKTTEDIENGTSGLASIHYGGGTWYCMTK